MSAASRALADVRGWLCDNLSEGDAGKVCGMLSVVSRHIAELEDENARLRSCLSDDAENARQIMAENAKLREQGARLFDKTLELGTENAKLRELIQKAWKCERNGCYECPLEEDCKVLCVYDGDCGIAVEIEKGLQELGIEVPHD